MKKMLTLGVILALSTSMTLAATNYTSALKNAIKQDIETSKQEAKDYNASVKDAIKKDIEAKAKAAEQEKINTAKAQKAQKLNEINLKITELNKEKAKIQSNNKLTYTERAIKTKAIEKQLEYYNKQKEALK